MVHDNHTSSNNPIVIGKTTCSWNTLLLKQFVSLYQVTISLSNTLDMLGYSAVLSCIKLWFFFETLIKLLEDQNIDFEKKGSFHDVKIRLIQLAITVLLKLSLPLWHALLSMLNQCTTASAPTCSLEMQYLHSSFDNVWFCQMVLPLLEVFQNSTQVSDNNSYWKGLLLPGLGVTKPVRSLNFPFFSSYDVTIW